MLLLNCSRNAVRTKTTPTLLARVRRCWTRQTLRYYSLKKKDDCLATLVLLRHGQSTWNANPVFTGWADPPLTDRGVAEAREAGALLHTRGFTHFDVAFTSQLDRAIRTCEIALEAARCSTLIIKAFQLNERHYGALQGRRKNDAELLKMYGKEQLRKWRRDFRAIPPPMDDNHPYYQPPPAPLTGKLIGGSSHAIYQRQDWPIPQG